MTQEFHLSVTPIGNYEYLVRTEQSEPGVPPAEEQVTWPIDRWLQQSRTLMRDPLLQMLQQGNLAASPDLSGLGELFEGATPEERRSRSLQDLASLGRDLYDHLFHDSVRERWMMAQAVAHHRKVPLRLRLGLKSAELNRLPWEVLHDDSNCPLAAGTQVLFSRYWPSPTVRRPNPPAPMLGSGLRILIAVSTPRDRTNLALPQETRYLIDELQAVSTPAAQIELLEQPDRYDLAQALEGGGYHIFHYSGHSASGRDGGEIALVNRKHGIAETLSGNDLAGMLANNGVQLAVFNSCRGAYRDSDDSGTHNLAEAAIARRIPAVLAMAERIPDDVALSLTKLFYRHISQGQAIDLSLNRARQGLISSFGSRQFYWALPVFHLAPEFDGLLIRPSLEDKIRQIESRSPFDRLPASSPEPPALAPSLDDLLPDRLPEDEPVELSAEVTDEVTDEAMPEVFADVLAEPETPDRASGSAASSAGSSAANPTRANPTGASSSHGRVSASGGRPTLPRDRPRSPAELARDRPSRSGRAAAAIALAAGAVLLGVGSSWWQSRSSGGPEPPSASLVAPAQNAFEIDRLVSETSAAIARGDLERATPAIGQLLDLSDLERADLLLNSIPASDRDRGEVLFLFGRWAWQTAVSGEIDASYDDAMRYWEQAVEHEPTSLLYRTALGWAYYADAQGRERLDEARLNDADFAWQEALNLARQPEASVAGSNLDRKAVRQSLEAGVALLLDRRNRRDRAIEARDAILAGDALALSDRELAKNWLWTPTAIQQWQNLVEAAPVTPPEAP
ncbi:MAG: CHAT domain-containing protein [Geitlerinemataceae cyanobacterium]